MSKRLAWLAAAGVTVAAAAAGFWNIHEPHKTGLLHGEAREAEQGRPPVDGDYWAIRVGYGGDPQHVRFEPTWLLDAAKQDK